MEKFVERIILLKLKIFSYGKKFRTKNIVEEQKMRILLSDNQKIIYCLMFRAAMGQVGNPFSIFLLEDQKLHDG
jgi:hypothetical protein